MCLDLSPCSQLCPSSIAMFSVKRPGPPPSSSLAPGPLFQIIVWNISQGSVAHAIDCHPEVIFSMSLNRDGSLLATTCKDKKLRIIEPRSGRVLQVRQVTGVGSEVTGQRSRGGAYVIS